MTMRTLLSLLFCLSLSLHAADNEPLAALVGVLKDSKDPQLQLDILRGMTDAVKGRRSVAMPMGWAEVEGKLGASPNSEIKTLAQSLGLTFGSQKALAALRETVLNTK